MTNGYDRSRGNQRRRAERKLWLLAEFGNGIIAPCSFCGELLDFYTITVDCYPVPRCEGGTYDEGNIRPACHQCNSEHGSQMSVLLRTK